MKKILIISDTHGDKRKYREVIEKEKPDVTIHAGDFCINYDVISQDFDYIVAGNNDFEGEEILDFEIEGLKFRLMHGHQFPMFHGNLKAKHEYLYNYAKDNDIDILITGHTHIEYFYNQNETTIINPGSLIMPRNTSLSPTYAILLIDNKKIINNNFEDVIMQFN